MYEDNQTYQLILNRRSCRFYRPELPKREELEAVMAAARLAPCALHKELCHFYVITDPELLEKESKLVSEKMERYANKDHRFGAPVLVLVCAPKNWDLAVQDASCAMMNMMLAASALGLGSCWINQPFRLSDDPDFRALMAPIGLGEDERVCAALAIGYPAKPALFSREPFGNFVTWVAKE